jgi:Cap4 SAVED domain
MLNMTLNQIESVDLDNDLDVYESNYDAIIDVIQEDIKVNDRVEASFHFLKYHDCIDREGDFLKTLRKHLVYYCFPKARYRGKTVDEITDLVFEGRDKFFNAKDSANGRKGSSRSGELGEIALYFLLESYLKAPQIISKMSLKTTQGENFKGSDGIHLGLQGGKKCIYYCESKLNKKRDLAFDDCVKSILDFQGRKKNFEISIINNHIDVSDPALRDAIIEFLDPTKIKGDDWLEVHSCFIGFNWAKFTDIETVLPNEKLMDELKKQFASEIVEMKTYLSQKITYPTIRQRFFFFVMPFKDIDTLRSNFLTLLYGDKK